MKIDPGEEKVPQVEPEETGKKVEVLRIKEPTDINGVKKSEIGKVDRISSNKRNALLHGKKLFENSIKMGNWKRQNKNKKRNLTRKKSTFRSNIQVRKGMKIVKKNSLSKKDVTGSKKSGIYEGMKVHGQSGKIHVKTLHNNVNLTSETGNLVVYLENPRRRLVDHEDHSSDITVTGSVSGEVKKKDVVGSQKLRNTEEKSDKASVHLIENVIGLKKSIVTGPLDTKIRKQQEKAIDGGKRSDHNPCLIPPCST